MKFKDMPYERIDFAKAKAELLEIMEKSKAAKSGEEQFEVHKMFYRLNDKIQTQVTLCSIRHTIDTTDEFYEKEQNYYDEQIPEYSNLCVEYQKILFYSPYREVLEGKIGQVAFKNMEIAMKSVSEENTQSKINLIHSIQTIVVSSVGNEKKTIKGIRENRKKEQMRTHQDYVKAGAFYE